MTEYVEHITVDGERWDQIAHRYYGDVFAYGPIIAANPHVPIRPVLPGGIRLLIPVRNAPALADLPPWKRGDAP